MTPEEQKTYEWLMEQSEPSRRKSSKKVVCSSLFVAAISIILMVQYYPTMRLAALSIGGLTFSAFGALLLAYNSLTSRATNALSSMTRFNGNPMLFARLEEGRQFALAGMFLVAIGFLLLGLGILLP